KKPVGRMVVRRDPRPSPDATFDASMTWSASFFSMICCCTSRGISSHTSSGAYGLLMSTVAPGAAGPSVSSLYRKSNLWTPTKLADFRRYGARTGRGPNRRWEIVYEPDFFE